MVLLIAELAGAYFAFALLIGFMGRGRKLGGWGYFFGSILLTPILGLLLLMASDRRPRAPRLEAKSVAEIERQIYRRSGGTFGSRTARR